MIECAQIRKDINVVLASKNLSIELPQEWFTVEEAARYLRVSKRTIYKWSSNGRLTAYLIGDRKHRRYRKGDLDGVPRLATIFTVFTNSNNKIFGAKDEPSSHI